MPYWHWFRILSDRPTLNAVRSSQVQFVTQVAQKLAGWDPDLVHWVTLTDDDRLILESLPIYSDAEGCAGFILPAAKITNSSIIIFHGAWKIRAAMINSTSSPNPTHLKIRLMSARFFWWGLCPSVGWCASLSCVIALVIFAVQRLWPDVGGALRFLCHRWNQSTWQIKIQEKLSRTGITGLTRDIRFKSGQ